MSNASTTSTRLLVTKCGDPLWENEDCIREVVTSAYLHNAECIHLSFIHSHNGHFVPHRVECAEHGASLSDAIYSIGEVVLPVMCHRSENPTVEMESCLVNVRAAVSRCHPSLSTRFDAHGNSRGGAPPRRSDCRAPDSEPEESGTR
jgi:hypothetical protein